MLADLKTGLADLDASAEVLLVVNRPDRRVEELAADLEVRLIEPHGNGYGKALMAAFAAARGDYLLTVDADLKGATGFIADLWSRRHAAEVTVASRYLPGSRAEMPIGRRILSRILNVVFSRGLSLKIHDMSSGVRLYRADLVRDRAYQATDFDILQEILVRAYMDGWRVQEIPFRL